MKGRWDAYFVSIRARNSAEAGTVASLTWMKPLAPYVLSDGCPILVAEGSGTATLAGFWSSIMHAAAIAAAAKCKSVERLHNDLKGVRTGWHHHVLTKLKCSTGNHQILATAKASATFANTSEYAIIGGILEGVFLLGCIILCCKLGSDDDGSDIGHITGNAIAQEYMAQAIQPVQPQIAQPPPGPAVLGFRQDLCCGVRRLRDGMDVNLLFAKTETVDRLCQPPAVPSVWVSVQVSNWE
ncbi:hypothetical protein BJ742DRAFT_870426 [Cladochytrium replicatum]|nr:hypothetical protein BJ742DRAFT_870426 [Cladochytrium replicatum]